MYETGKGNTIHCRLQQRYNKFGKERPEGPCTM